MTITKKTSASLLKQLKEIRRISTMETASFGDIYSPTYKDETENIKRLTRLWRETWIIDPIDAIIKQIEEDTVGAQ